MKVDLTIYLMILIMYYKYFVYIWSKSKLFDFSKSENDIYFGKGSRPLLAFTTLN
jgi:hypothetical protein